MVDRDVVLAKIAAIDRCLGRIAEVRGPRGAVLLPVEAEEIIELNLQRAVQAAIELGRQGPVRLDGMIRPRGWRGG